MYLGFFLMFTSARIVGSAESMRIEVQHYKPRYKRSTKRARLIRRKFRIGGSRVKYLTYTFDNIHLGFVF